MQVSISSTNRKHDNFPHCLASFDVAGNVRAPKQHVECSRILATVEGRGAVKAQIESRHLVGAEMLLHKSHIDDVEGRGGAQLGECWFLLDSITQIQLSNFILAPVGEKMEFGSAGQGLLCVGCVHLW